MSYSKKLLQSIKKGYKITKDDALKLCDEPIDELCNAANELRNYFCKNSFDICTIINAKSGKCSENCKYCAQSIHYSTHIKEYPLLDIKDIVKESEYNASRGILRFSVVTSGRTLSDDEVDQLCECYREMKARGKIALCASHGLLTIEQFKKIKDAGVSRYHNNLETSRRFFPSICTTHTYDDKIKTIKNAQSVGLEVCSGGIIGLGESMKDRMDMIFDLRELGIKSIPVNVLNPIKGTPLENLNRISKEEILKTVAIFRFVIPEAAIRLAGGRGLMEDKGESAFVGGSNAAISGDMLTTLGISIDEDMEVLHNLGFEVKII